MRYVLVTPPSALFTVEQLKVHLRAEGPDEDSLIEAYAAAAIGYLDGRAGIMGRAIGSQTWRLDADGPCGGRVAIEMPDITSVTFVKYLDTAGTEQTWSADEWRLGSDGRFFFVEPKEGFSWPSTIDQEDAIRITFVAGMAATYPGLAAVKAALLLMVGDLYQNRETVGANLTAIPMSTTVDRLIAPYRIRSL